MHEQGMYLGCCVFFAIFCINREWRNISGLARTNQWRRDTGVRTERREEVRSHQDVTTTSPLWGRSELVKRARSFHGMEALGVS